MNKHFIIGYAAANGYQLTPGLLALLEDNANWTTKVLLEQVINFVDPETTVLDVKDFEETFALKYKKGMVIL